MTETQNPAYFQTEPLPTGASLAGWAALIQRLSIQAPLSHASCISARHISGTKRTKDSWDIYDKRYLPEDSLAGHLSFAMRHERMDLLVLKRILDKAPQDEIKAFIQSTPTGAVARRVWFFYETLIGQRLDIDDAPVVTAVDALDSEAYFTTKGTISLRHRVRDNLLGTGAFCPLIRRTPKLESFIALDLSRKASTTLGKVSTQLVSRAASFLLLADSRASFEIEGERPPLNRLERWGRAVLEAGKRPLNQTEIVRLHRILIGDDRFTHIGYRTEGVFLGERDHHNDPLPEFIGARADDLAHLMTGLNECNNRLRPSEVDPVLQAAALSFGFIYIHPLADGNGRLHRCLVHHVLAERKFTPPGMVFPVSSVMLDRIDTYRQTLQGHSAPLMAYIEWCITPTKNVDVTNDTSDLYRFFDCTEEAEFLYACVQRTVEHDLPKEIAYLTCHEQALNDIMNAIEMPDQMAQSIIMFVRQNNGTLPKKRRTDEFSKLTDSEVGLIEKIISKAFEPLDSAQE